ncbi:MAG: hypothetical protein IKR53_03400 [Clostridia bacterium]|nr:hypothetical protein [Clostridia bacterium]
MTIDNDSPRIILDESGEVETVWPEGAPAADPMMVTDVMRALGRSGLERLRDFCSTPPAFPDDPLCGAKNRALFRLRSEKYSFAAAVKRFRFPGHATDLFPIPAEGWDRALMGDRVTGPAARLLRELFPGQADGDGQSPFPSLGAASALEADLSSDRDARRLVRTVVRQLAATPGSVCGRVRVAPFPRSLPGSGSGRVTVSPGVLTYIVSLLSSALGAVCGARPAEIRAGFEGGALRIEILSRPARAPRGFFATDDVLSLCGIFEGDGFSRLASACVIAASENVSLSSVRGEGRALGFRVTVFPSFGEAPEFKEDPGLYLLGEVASELAEFFTTPPSEAAPEGE